MQQLMVSMATADRLRRSVCGTSMLAFTFWHIPRNIDSTVIMGIRGVPELIESQPWAGKQWARREGGTGYTVEEADRLAAEVVPAEVLDYADAVRSNVGQWPNGVTDQDLEAPHALIEHQRPADAYNPSDV